MYPPNFPTYGNAGYIFSWPDSQMPGEVSKRPQKILFHALINLLIPVRVCKRWKLAGLRLEVLQGPGTAVQPQLEEPTQEGLCMHSHHPPREPNCRASWQKLKLTLYEDSKGANMLLFPQALCHTNLAWYLQTKNIGSGDYLQWKTECRMLLPSALRLDQQLFHWTFHKTKLSVFPHFLKKKTKQWNKLSPCSSSTFTLGKRNCCKTSGPCKWMFLLLS